MISLTQPQPTQDNYISHGKKCYGLALIAVLQSGIVGNVCKMEIIKWASPRFHTSSSQLLLESFCTECPFDT
ncbi:hypothetical protein HAX54_026980 [Datura stramonium]|uniref:Uncharacterized protein n=1 Tax=Datura stramonium TaxID=4076 RepID=A0ABS8S8B0_DATST|nr:hypothetical protein [Datura stramonium]